MDHCAEEEVSLLLLSCAVACSFNVKFFKVGKVQHSGFAWKNVEPRQVWSCIIPKHQAIYCMY